LPHSEAACWGRGSLDGYPTFPDPPHGRRTIKNQEHYGEKVTVRPPIRTTDIASILTGQQLWMAWTSPRHGSRVNVRRPKSRPMGRRGVHCVSVVHNWFTRCTTTPATAGARSAVLRQLGWGPPQVRLEKWSGVSAERETPIAPDVRARRT